MAQKGAKEKQNLYYRPVAYVAGVQPQPLGKGEVPYTWESHFKDALKSYHSDLEEMYLPAKVFHQPTLCEFVNVIEEGLKVEVRIHDYDNILETKGYWIASVIKIAGYRMLLRYAGMDQEEDKKHDFWVNVGSEEVRHVGFCSNTEGCDLLPPNIIRKRQSDWCKYLLDRLNKCRTFARNWPTEQKEGILAGKFKVGMRLELIDKAVSTRVRPARIIKQLGRRICVQVTVKDCNPDDISEEEDQVNPGVWMDQNSSFIFPVGWAVANGYDIAAKESYLAHCRSIADAIHHGSEPFYEEFDVKPSHFNDWTKNPTDVPSLVEWKEGMKFECLDPLNNTFQELRMATVLKVLKDGYLKIGFDGPEIEEESIAIHSTSPLLFPCGYAQKYAIRLSGPQDMDMENFDWEVYLKEQNAVMAPMELFEEIPDESVMSKFKKGSKLESTDLCEPQLICAATIVGTKGRLVLVHFDGWEDNYDQLFNYTSHEFFPVGWCEIYGYKLEHPKVEEPTKKKRKTK